MPIMMIMEWDGVTPEQYDQLKQLVNWETDVPAGGIFHVTAFSEQGANHGYLGVGRRVPDLRRYAPHAGCSTDRDSERAASRNLPGA
jgi:hypothetical protein